MIELLVATFDHIVDGLHDFLSIVSVFLAAEEDLLCLTDLANKVELSLSLIIDVGNRVSEGDIGILHLGLRVLHT